MSSISLVAIQGIVSANLAAALLHQSLVYLEAHAFCNFQIIFFITNSVAHGLDG
jgi:hypothetical protein